MTVEERILDRLHEEALAENEERDWRRTGRIRCQDCGARVRTDNLTSLPEHRCSRRQGARRAAAAVDEGLDGLFRRLGPPPAEN